MKAKTVDESRDRIDERSSRKRSQERRSRDRSRSRSRSQSRSRSYSHSHDRKRQDRRSDSRDRKKSDRWSPRSRRSRDREVSRDRDRDRGGRYNDRERSRDRTRRESRDDDSSRRRNESRRSDRGERNNIRDSNLKQHRKQDRLNGNSNNKTSDKTAEEIKKSTEELEAERQAELEYNQRVEAQMKMMGDDDNDEEPVEEVVEDAEARRKRREELLRKLSANQKSNTPSKSPSPDINPSSSTISTTSNSNSPLNFRSSNVSISVPESNSIHTNNNSAEVASGIGEPLPLTPTSTITTTTTRDQGEINIFEPSSVDDLEHEQPATIGGGGAPADECTDHEGFYRFRLGDMLNDRYRVFAYQGRGVFSTVVRVRDTQCDDRELVVKVIRNNETMYKVGQQEVQFLKALSSKDTENKHVVRLIGDFEHRYHLCLVFEPLSLNLREVLKKYGGVGLNISAIRVYAKQLFTALQHLKKCDILHGDIKLDNILVNESKSAVKLCDFGSAGKINKCVITPYMVSRFYRAPEISLGLPYNEQIDIWSVGCVLYELYTGKILFTGSDNNEMLRMMMDVKGPFPNKLLKKAKFVNMYFDSDLNFKMQKVDPLTKLPLTKIVKIVNPKTDIGSMLRQNAQSLTSDKERHKVVQLGKLLDKIFTLDPQRRMTVQEALQDPFLRDD